MGSYYVCVAFQLIYQLSYIWMLILLAKHFKNVDALLQKLLWTQVVVNCLVTANGHLPREHIFFQDRLFTQFFQFIYLFQVLLTIIGAAWLIARHTERVRHLGIAMIIFAALPISINIFVMLIFPNSMICTNTDTNLSPLKTLFCTIIRHFHYIETVCTLWLLIAMRIIFVK